MKAKTVTGYEPRFDIDMKRGKVGEDRVLHILDALTESRVEVKTDYGVWKTGNFFVEFEKQNRSGDWVPSGIETTEADYWAFAFRDGALVVETGRLRDIVNAYREDPSAIGFRPGNSRSAGARGVKLPLAALNIMLTSFGDDREEKPTKA